jgi:hypothetical protein
MPQTVPTATRTLEQRNQILRERIAAARESGAWVDFRAETMAVIVRGKPIDHMKHLMMVGATLGLWIPIWGAYLMFKGERRFKLDVDEIGEVTTRPISARVAAELTRNHLEQSRGIKNTGVGTMP